MSKRFLIMAVALTAGLKASPILPDDTFFTVLTNGQYETALLGAASPDVYAATYFGFPLGSVVIMNFQIQEWTQEPLTWLVSLDAVPVVRSEPFTNPATTPTLPPGGPQTPQDASPGGNPTEPPGLPDAPASVPEPASYLLVGLALLLLTLKKVRP